jgi:hypothetical protein
MAQLVHILYGILIFVYFVVSIFIVYHLYRYTLHRPTGLFLSAVFVGVSVVLFLLNMTAYTAVDLEAVFGGSPSIF